MQAPQPKLLDQVRDRIRVKHYSIRTEHAYVDWIKRFIYFHGKRHLKDLGPAEVESLSLGKTVRVFRRLRRQSSWLLTVNQETHGADFINIETGNKSIMPML